MTIRHALPASEVESRLLSSLISTRYADTGAADSNAANPWDTGKAEMVATLPSSVSAVSSPVPSSITAGRPALICGATSRSTQTSACTDWLPLDHVFAGLYQYAVHRDATGHVAKEEPSSEDEQRQSDDGDKQTLPRRGDGQQPVELFTFFLGFCNGILKRVEWIIEHGRV